MSGQIGRSPDPVVSGSEASKIALGGANAKTKKISLNNSKYKAKPHKKQPIQSTHAQGKTGRKRPSERSYLNDKRRNEIAKMCREALAETDYVPAKAQQCNPLPDNELLHSLFTKAWEHGVLISATDRSNIKAGDQVGLKHPEKFNGYQAVYIHNKRWLAHRIIFKLAHGRDPIGALDHIDGNRANNHPDNLREATPLLNARNRHKALSNTGRLGVSWFKGVKRYSADISLGGKQIKLGRYVRLSDAIEARKIGESIIFADPSELEVLA